LSYVTLAYVLTVGLIVGYAWTVARRRRALEREEADLELALRPGEWEPPAGST